MTAFTFTDNFLKALPAERLRKIEEKLATIGMRPEIMEERIDRWFSNFRDSAQKEIALKLFIEIDYFDEHRIENILATYKNKLTQYLSEKSKTLSNVILVTPEENADSADFHAYKLTKDWGILQSQVLKHNEIDPKTHTDKCFVFFNDTHGSGNQFVKEFSTLVRQLGCDNCFIVCFAITRKAFDLFMEQLPGITIIPELPTPAIHEKTLFSPNELKVIQSLGEKVYPPHPMGYGECGLLVAYHFQCPNNNLPIVWANGVNNSYNDYDQGYPWIYLYEYKRKQKLADQRSHGEIHDELSNLIRISDALQQCRKDAATYSRRKCFLQLLEELGKSDDKTFQALELKARILRQITLEARTSKEYQNRSAQIRNTYEAIFSLNIDNSSLGLAIEGFSNWVVDYSQRSGNVVGVNKIVALLNTSIKKIGELIGPHPPENSFTAEMLALRAKSKRALASLKKRRMRSGAKVKAEIDRIRGQALGDAEKAYALSDSSLTMHELALCLFANTATLQSAEAHRGLELLRQASDQGSVLAGYELVKQFRMRHRYIESLDLFKLLEETEGNRRRFHSNLYMFSATMIGIYYDNNGFGSHKDDFFLARDWLEETIAQDHYTAIDIIDFCEINLICGFSEKEAFKNLDLLKPGSQTAWDQVIEIAKKEASGDETAAGALLIGLENPTIWSRIGTLYADFTSDYKTALEFYDRAILIDYRNPIYHYNKARVLALKNYDYKAAKLAVDLAKSKEKYAYGWFRTNAEEFAELELEIQRHLAETS